MRDRTTSRADFIFFVDRLATFLIEKAMEKLPSKPKNVITPVGVEYNGRELDAQVCVDNLGRRIDSSHFILDLWCHNLALVRVFPYMCALKY